MALSATVDTVNDIFTKVSDALGESTPDTSSKRQRWLKDVLQDIYNRRRWSWALVDGTPITLVNGTANYSLATDFTEDAMYEVKRTDANNNDFYYSPIFEFQKRATQNGISEDPVYYVRGNRADGYQIYLIPTPDASQNGQTLNYKYNKTISDFAAALTDKIPLPDSTALWIGVLKEVYRSQQRLNEYQLARQEYEAAIQELVNTDIETERALESYIYDYRDWVGIPSDWRNQYDY